MQLYTAYVYISKNFCTVSFPLWNTLATKTYSIFKKIFFFYKHVELLN